MRRFRTEGDDPNEYWAVCDDCDGTGSVSIVVLDDDGSFDETITEPGTCPACDGPGFIAAEADDFNQLGNDCDSIVAVDLTRRHKSS